MHGEVAKHERNLRKKWPTLIAIVPAILAACLPTFAQQQAALSYFVEFGACSSGSGWRGRRRRLNRTLPQRRLLSIARGLFLILRAAAIAIRPATRRSQGDDGHVHIQDVKRGPTA